MQGWISLHRKIQGNWLWNDKPFSKGQAWIDLLLMVNHEAGKVYFRDSVYEVERGQRITSELHLGDRWGWSRNKVRKFLDDLEKEHMLIVKKDKRKTTIEVVNYDNYQDNKTTEGTTESTSKSTSKRHQKDTNNNVNKVNNENKKDIVEIISYLNEKSGKRFSDSTKNTVKLINGRLNEGKTIDQFKRVIDLKTKQWLNDEKMNKYLAPDTLFNEKNFEKYLNEKVVQAKPVQSTDHKSELEDMKRRMGVL